jgi:2-dehydro-3-deoxyphosphogluconate aldolase/(4S)-4-hydroxy-2-oxoglutarate aldolase
VSSPVPWPQHLSVIPVVTVSEVETAVPLARALAAGGLPVIEVTLRTPQALEAIARIRAEVPDVLCAAGTLLTEADVAAAVRAGAQALVTPGAPAPLLEALLATGLPCLPGAMTPTEALALLECEVTTAKLFPAESAGGPKLLSAMAGPFPTLRWCATGGITQTNAAEYLRLPNVFAVGGSWMVPPQAVADHAWTSVTKAAKQAAGLRTSSLLGA